MAGRGMGIRWEQGWQGGSPEHLVVFFSSEKAGAACQFGFLRIPRDSGQWDWTLPEPSPA